MSEQRREITLSASTAILLILLTTAQCEMARDVDRIADTADARMCIEAVKAEIEDDRLPKPCQEIFEEKK